VFLELMLSVKAYPVGCKIMLEKLLLLELKFLEVCRRLVIVLVVGIFYLVANFNLPSVYHLYMLLFLSLKFFPNSE